MNDAAQAKEIVSAQRKAPPVPGLYVFPKSLSDGILEPVLAGIARDDLFSSGRRDQVMLFDAPSGSEEEDPVLDDEIGSSLPSYLLDLITSVHDLIAPSLPSPAIQVLFNQQLSRQVIINLYPPGEGISPHIDLPHRYADGILGVSLCGGCVMMLRHEPSGRRRDIYLPPQTVYCLTGEARWEWSHGIEGRKVDVVKDEAGRRVTMMRELRVSVTFRWMKEGADELVERAAE